jgi:superkiller protein 3
MLRALAVPERLRGVEAGEKASSSRKMTLLSLGAKLYAKALRLQPDNASCWHDLAFNYHLRSKLGATAEEGRALRERARMAAKKAIALEPSSHAHWSALGVLTLSDGDFAMAQHCFIRSIQTENNAIAWTNLGIMYLLEE